MTADLLVPICADHDAYKDVDFVGCKVLASNSLPGSQQVGKLLERRVQSEWPGQTPSVTEVLGDGKCLN